MTQRVADIEDMKQRLIAIMQGQKHIDLTKLSDNTVIIADEIHPSMTANMDTDITRFNSWKSIRNPCCIKC